MVPGLCLAEVLNSGPGGFTVNHTVNTTASQKQLWETMVNHIDEWWHPDHTWSGDARNLYIKAELGGCFCEHLSPQDGNSSGGVEHLRIVYLKPYHEIRFDGALGPLQTMAVQGRMVWKVAAGENDSSITFTYMVHGFLEGGFADLAPAVDGVISQQLDRLGKRLEPR